MKQETLILFCIILLYGSFSVLGQGEICRNIEPFCADSELVFENSNRENSTMVNAEIGPYYGELESQPYPSWYFLQIGQGGNLDFVISQTENADESGMELDVDYAVWGPFSQTDDICSYEMLGEENLVNSSFSNKAIETLSLEAAEVGQIYVVVITNFQTLPGYIKLEQENIGEPDAGATDCFQGGLEDEIFGCQGESLIIDGTTLFAESYQWFEKIGEDFVKLENENGAYLEVEKEGFYQLVVSNNFSEIIEDIVYVDFNPKPIACTPEDLYICDPNQTTIDLSAASAEILNGNTAEENYRVNFYESIQELEAENPISNPTAFPVEESREIVAQVEGIESGCLSNEVIFNVELTFVPENFLPEESVICVDLDGTVLDNQGIGEDLGADYTYEWIAGGNTISTEAVLNFAVTPNFNSVSLIVTDNRSGCSIEFNTTLLIYSRPETVEIEIEGSDFTGGYIISAEAIPGPGNETTYEYRADNSNWQESTVFRNLDPGNHTISAREINGCGITTSEEFYLVGYPRFFTPNSDGYNDTWNIENTAEIQIKKLYVFDRYGKLIKELTPGGAGWDGTYNGRTLPADDYWFRVEFEKDGANDHFGANFTLKR
ncbi:T9SS type B sorting domain-containing protein [Salegentibacter agarivorans]